MMWKTGLNSRDRSKMKRIGQTKEDTDTEWLKKN